MQQKLMAMSSATSYFGQAKEFVKNKFSENSIWKRGMEDNNSWISSIRFGIEKKVSAPCIIQKWRSISEKSTPIGRKLVIKCCNNLL
jgi:hypothetical protein